MEQQHKLSSRWEQIGKEKNIVKPQPVTEKEIEYAKKISNMQEVELTKEEQKKSILNALKAVLLNGSTETIKKIFIQDPELKELYYTLLEFYFGEKYTEKGGLYIFSETGVGKTTAVRAIWFLSQYLTTGIKNGGKYEIQSMGNLIRQRNTGVDNDLSFSLKSHLIIDELSEKINNVQSFGYKHSLSDVIEARYDLWKSHGFKTIITTNLIADVEDINYPDIIRNGGISQYIDGRSIGRIKEQYHIINLTGKSKR